MAVFVKPGAQTGHRTNLVLKAYLCDLLRYILKFSHSTETTGIQMGHFCIAFVAHTTSA